MFVIHVPDLFRFVIHVQTLRDGISSLKFVQQIITIFADLSKKPHKIVLTLVTSAL